jgi:hypothetical protein
MSRLWQVLEPFVASGRETRKVDLKREVDVSGRSGQAKLAHDIAAIANTSGGTGYLIIGVLDTKERTGVNPANYAVGFRPPDLDEFQRTVLQALDNYCKPVPDIRFEEMIHPDAGKPILVVVVLRSIRRPHEIIREGEGVRKGIFVRRGAETFQASGAELAEMYGRSSEVCLVVNLGRPLSPTHLQQIEQVMDDHVLEVIEPDIVPFQFDNEKSYSEQAKVLLNGLGLVSEDWQMLRLVVNLPGLAPAAAAILAEMHGRMGHFPHVIRMRPSTADQSVFEVAEVIPLQNLRDAARGGALGL